MRGAVAIVRTQRVEWYELSPRGERYGQASVEGATVNDLAQAVLRARRAAGSKLGRCRLALGDDVVMERVLSLPRLTRKEYAQVLERKAAALLGRDVADVSFCARKFGTTFEAREEGPAEERELPTAGTQAQSPWLLCAASRSLVRDLRLQLAREGVLFVDCVSLRLARLSWLLDADRLATADPAEPAAETAPAAEEARGKLTIDVDDGGVNVALADSEGICHLSFLRGELSQSAALATNLMQELRSVEAWWRKQNRGRRLESIACMGLSPDRGAIFEHALRATFPGVRVHGLASTAGRGPGTAPTLCSAALSRGAFALDVAVAIPLRHSQAMLVTASILVAGALGGMVIQRQVADEARSAARAAAEDERAAADLGVLSRANAESARRLADLQAEVLRLEQLQQAGLPLAGLVADCFQAVDASAAQIERVELAEDGQLALEFALAADALPSVRIIEAAREKLEQSEHVEGVLAAPNVLERRSAGDGRQQERLLVHFDALWRGTR